MDPDPDQDPYHWLVDPDPAAQKHVVRIRNTGRQHTARRISFAWMSQNEKITKWEYSRNVKRYLT